LSIPEKAMISQYCLLGGSPEWDETIGSSDKLKTKAVVVPAFKHTGVIGLSVMIISTQV
jgi:hypothetical protein